VLRGGHLGRIAGAVPTVNIVPFKDGLMHGERILYDAAMFAEQVGLDVHELRAAASRV